MKEIYHSNEEQSNFATKLKNLDKGEKQMKNGFLKVTEDYYFAQKKKFLIILKADYF